VLVNCTVSNAIATPTLAKKIASGSGMVGRQTDEANNKGGVGPGLS